MVTRSCSCVFSTFPLLAYGAAADPADDVLECCDLRWNYDSLANLLCGLGPVCIQGSCGVCLEGDVTSRMLVCQGMKDSITFFSPN